MNVLSLFDGMSCGQIALKELGVSVCNYFASEIDKHAIDQTQLNFPNTMQLGDVRGVSGKLLPKIDLVLAGSPCQGFSFAGKQLNFDDPRSKLFFEFERILKEVREKNPKVRFLLENVRMKKESERVINEALGLQPVVINSSLVSAQNRHRLYWSNIKIRKEGLFGDFITDIPQPKDRGLVLRDIVELEVDEKYFLKKTNDFFVGLDLSKKSKTLRVSGAVSQSEKHNYDIIKLDKSLCLKKDQAKASCFTAGGNSGGNHSDMDIICVPMRGRNPYDPSDRTVGAPTAQRLEAKTDGKTNCLTTVSKDNLVLGCDVREKRVRVRRNGKPGTLMARARTDESCAQLVLHIQQKGRGYNKGGCHYSKSPTLTSCSWEHNNLLSEQYTLRRLTPMECARLQTIPEWYKWDCSETQQYKMLGNGWTVEVIKHIFSYLK